MPHGPLPPSPSRKGRGSGGVCSPPPLAGGGWGEGGTRACYLDADDLLAPDALSRLVAALDASPSAVAAIGAYAFVDTAYVRHPPSGDTLRRLLVGNLFANGGHLLVRSEAIRAVGGFLPGIAYGEDWEFWIRIALRGPFVAAPVVCQCYSSASSPAGHIIAWPPIQPPSHPVWKRSSAIRLCLPASVPGASPQSADAPKLRTIGSSAAN